MFYTALASSPGEGRGRFPIAHQVRRLLAISARITASADVAVYIVNAFRYPIIIAWRMISFAILASPGTVSKFHAPITPGTAISAIESEMKKLEPMLRKRWKTAEASA